LILILSKNEKNTNGILEKQAFFSYFYKVSKDEIIVDQKQKITILSQENSSLKQQNDLLRKALYGKKSERFIPPDLPHNQPSLFEDQQEAVNKEKEEVEVEVEQITYQRKKTKKHPGRHPLPDHLPTREVIIEPEEDTTGMVKIGEEVSITLEYTPASLVKVITRRPKYARPKEGGILIGQLPTRPIPKGIPEASLLAHIIVAKFIDHLPFYRQIQRFKRDYQWIVNPSTINDWFKFSTNLLKPLYDKMKNALFEGNYLQVDESPMKVQDKNKKGTTHQGYQWVYRNPINGIVIFNYRKGRGMHGPKEILKDFKGYLQSDGYKVYDKIGQHPDIILVGCWAHARRKFFDAKGNDAKRASIALQFFKAIYAHDKKAKESNNQTDKKDYRNKYIQPIMLQLKAWAEENKSKVLPKSPIGKAINYLLLQWHKLIAVLQNGQLEIDNNLIENKIRPLALGRKNYLFAGSHEAAERIAMMYSFFASCKANDINPFEWLKNTLSKIPETKMSELHLLIPGADKKTQEDSL